MNYTVVIHVNMYYTVDNSTLEKLLPKLVDGTIEIILKAHGFPSKIIHKIPVPAVVPNTAADTEITSVMGTASGSDRLLDTQYQPLLHTHYCIRNYIHMTTVDLTGLTMNCENCNCLMQCATHRDGNPVDFSCADVRGADSFVLLYDETTGFEYGKDVAWA